ncbi:unnamed protein product [Dovyalis caffra]|uniref:Serine/threonine-protein kinase TOR n=1 Tax=Dovyalis caffra TaxID=77055 RepID=A0AAV1RAQ7_9ROSI|nr:unnamed protein product [Dovyalis caffra]
MASTSQSLRFLVGPATTGPGGGSFDALNRILADLCTRGNPKEGATLSLRKHLEEEARDLSGEAFPRFMDHLYERISTLLESNEVAENLGALRAIEELIDIALGENASKVSKFAIYMRSVFEMKRDPDVLTLASRVLGHLARAGGAMIADEVEFQVKMVLGWLRNDKAEFRLFASVLILKEVAENASTVFNVHVPEFVDAIWVALRHPTLAIRERAVEALRACLRVIEKQVGSYGGGKGALIKGQNFVLTDFVALAPYGFIKLILTDTANWYYRMFEATQDGLGKNAPVHSIHGSLLAVGELLSNIIGAIARIFPRDSAEQVVELLFDWLELVSFIRVMENWRLFMMSRYREVAEIVLRYLEHRDRLVRLSITSLLPRIAHFLRDRFVTNYLEICMNHILAVLRIPAERGSGFIALGEMAGALDGELVHYLPTITAHLRDAIAPRRAKPSLEALACVGNIAKAMGPAMEPHVRSLLDVMLSAGLSATLVDALEQISPRAAVPVPPVRGGMTNAPQQVSDLSGSALVQLALQTLARFNFKGHELLEFARESVVVYLDDEDGATRKDAALCCCKLVANSFSGMASTQFGSSRSNRTGGKRWRLIEELVEKLLIAAVADADVTVRQSIFSSLHGNRGFDDFLAQADSLSAVFAALNDEDFDVREYAISVAGRLSEKNPAYVLPALRRHLIQLLTYLKQSADNKCREESAKLLGCLIRNCERLVLPYIAPIHKALVARLLEGTGVNANNGIISGVLVTVGDLARVGGFAMRQYISELMPLIVEALLDGAAVTKREVAVATLGQVVQSTGYVITPYNEYPQLLGLLLKLLNGELVWSTRREVLKVLGIMGALDPHVHKRNQQNLPGSHGEVARAASDSGQHIPSMDELPMDLWPSFATSEDYYSTVAINSLMRILRDPSLASYHQKVVLPDLFHTVRTCDDYLKDFITWKLGTLVSIVRQVLHLVEQLCLALNDEFRKHLPVILPCCIQVLSDAERCNEYTYVLDILHMLEVFGDAAVDIEHSVLQSAILERSSKLQPVENFSLCLHNVGTLDEHMHLLLPALIRLFKVDASMDIRRAAIKTLTRLIPCVQIQRGYWSHFFSCASPEVSVGWVGDTDFKSKPKPEVFSESLFTLETILKNEEIRKDAVDALCCLAHALGEDFTIFIPSIHKLLLKHRLQHKEFEEIEGRLRRREPLILGSTAAQRLSRRLPVEVISDPLNDMDNDPYEDGVDMHRHLRGHQVNDGRLRTAGEASQRSTKEDWAEWMRHLSIELLKESPSPALRTCARLAQLQPFVGRELFAAGFVSCWAQLNEASQKHLVRSLEMAFSSPNIPPEILATLLNLAEFMEHDEKPLPIDIRLLGALADKCRAFAKALHYKEMEFEGSRSKKMDANPVAAVEALIHINNQLHQHEAAVGILTYAQQHLDVQLKESWYEKLQRWDDALKAYTVKASQVSSPHLVLEATLGRMRCLAALARWEELNNLCKEYWTPAEPSARLEMAPMAAKAAWNMGEWDQMAEYVSRLDDGDETKLRGLGNTAASGDGSSNGTFFRAVLLVRRGKYDEAREYVERARKCLATELAALVLESYERAYVNMVRVQQLSELEEVIDYCTLPVGNPVAEGRRALVRNMWTERIQGAKRNVEVWQAILAVRALVLPPTEDIDNWLKFASLCRKNNRISQARSTLIKLLQYDPETSPENMRYHGPPQVMLAYLKYQWSLGEDHKRKEAFARLQDLAIELSSDPNMQSIIPAGLMGGTGQKAHLLARVYLNLGTWQWALYPGLEDDSMQEILSSFRNATQYAPKWGNAWHWWALFNTAVMSQYTIRGLPNVASQFVVAAVTGYFHSIAFAANAKGVDDSLQDILRLLTLWFNHGATAEVQMALQKGFAHVNINTWLVVLPQIIARIHSNNHAVRELIQSLLVRIGQSHPQALMYPLLVACKSISNLRKAAAEEVVNKVRQHSGVLVDQAQLVSTELIRVAILWHEMWHEGLEEASRLYFGEHNIDGMLKVLEPLHKMLEEGAMKENITVKERAFIEAYRHELLEAWDCCMKYKKTVKEAELTQAWDLYYHVFRRIDKQLQVMTTLDLQSVSPELVECRDLELAVPGTYRAGIMNFLQLIYYQTLRPRKLTIQGSDGEDHAFLLKGHEDLRQDERVMQLFGLVNTLLENSRKTSEKDLSIHRYAVIPLSPNSGLIEWVPNCDTLHYLIREYRDARKITLNQEHKYMLSFAPDYDNLPLIAKVEVFEYALQNTEGNDLARILHIDFGDCFEASMNREKFPEKVPFRLTRMLVKAMEVSGIEGNFRSTCENVMQVLRTHNDSVMAMMEAFVHDPLINWRLFNFNEVPQMSMFANSHVPAVVNTEESAPSRELPQPQRGARERELLQAVNQLGDANEVLNERAVVVMARMSNKLTGRDFSTPSLSASSIQHAVDHSSLIFGDTREDHGLSVVPFLVKRSNPVA